jgi:hypothetical protein
LGDSIISLIKNCSQIKGNSCRDDIYFVIPPDVSFQPMQIIEVEEEWFGEGNDQLQLAITNSST